MAGTYSSITSPPPKTRMGGIQQKVFLCPYDDFTTLQAAVDGLVTTAHVVKAGKGFIEVYSTKDTGFVKMGAIGGSDRRSFRLTGAFYHPGESDEIIKFANQAPNDRWIMLFPLPGSTELIQAGSAEFQVELTAEYDSTKNSEDGRGWLFSVDCFMPGMIKYKAATIPMKTESSGG